MRLNENIAISTPDILLVPYDAHHVLTYHEWMQDPAIREATASDQLTLAEEFENQASWRTAADKLTFIVCRPRAEEKRGTAAVVAGVDDAPGRMLGDVNLFLTPWEPDDEDGAGGNGDGDVRYCNGEVDIMIAGPADRGRGLGKAAVVAFLLFVRRNLGGVLAEYGSAGDDGTEKEKERKLVLRDLVVKIKATNAGSIALFGSLGFRRKGEVNYFGEIQMVLEGFGEGGEPAWAAGKMGGYGEVVYDRSQLKK
ncbi:GNAT domain-containing protein [Whalleya microplaca]|nr:GNAT domain-containing protein [Whalleya microplaca]